jgi:hypothetical protein
MSVLNKLTEGIVNRDMKKEGEALLSKWEKTGLLEGLGDDTKKNGMARLLENQAKELLREAASTMNAGDVAGFASVAFPIVRRVFGGLIANDLVSVQPMSLPSGLIFFLDFTFGTAKLDFSVGDSLYGGAVVGSEITGGVDLSDAGGAEAGPYALNNGYASPTGSLTINGSSLVVVASGNVGGAAGDGLGGAALGGITQAQMDTLNKLVDYDPDLSGTICVVAEAQGTSDLSQLNVRDMITISAESQTNGPGRQIRRLTQVASGSTGNDPANSNFKFTLVFQATGSQILDTAAAGANNLLGCVTGNNTVYSFTIDDNFTNQGVGGVVGTTVWAMENDSSLPEINIKVDSIAVTAITKKLKAKWTPELGQDLNAYHNLDAEVELTSILSEQIALEIDQEILVDLIRGATAGTLYWSRSPGLFVNRETGAEIGASSAAPDFTGTVSEWYETLLETVNDVSARIHRKTLRGGANFLVTSPEVASILEFTAGFRASVTVDGDRGQAGAVKVGQLSKKLDVYVDPYFPRNVLLVGRRGGSFLESGFVYAPYVPLQVTPTIFGVEDFVPRKGVMTRYAKKMVRPDMYGLVICRGLIGEAGATT